MKFIDVTVLLIALAFLMLLIHHFVGGKGNKGDCDGCAGCNIKKCKNNC